VAGWDITQARSTTRLSAPRITRYSPQIVSYLFNVEPSVFLGLPHANTREAMMRSLFLLVAGLTGLAFAVDCSKTPSWTVKDFKLNSRDEVGSAGKASFSFTDNLSGKTDALSCTLVANYRCQFDGTPSDPNVTINIQAMMEVLYFSVSQKLACDGGAP